MTLKWSYCDTYCDLTVILWTKQTKNTEGLKWRLMLFLIFLSYLRLDKKKKQEKDTQTYL